MGEKICNSDLTLDALTAYIVGLGQPKFRAKQIFKWLHQKLVTDFSQMTDQPRPCWHNLRKIAPSQRPPSAAASNPRTVRSNICCNWPMATASRRF